jgi:hypothetical protein
VCLAFVTKVQQAEGVNVRTRRGHLSHRGPRSPRSTPKLGPAALAGTAIVAILAVVVVVLAVKLRDDGGGGRESVAPSDAAALAARLESAEASIVSLRKTIVGLGREVTGDLKQVTKTRAAQTRRAQRLESCIVQLQDQVDDLQAYLSYGTAPRASRVSGACVSLLKPRFRR